MRELGKELMSTSHPPITSPGAYGSTEAAGKTGMAQGGGGKMDGRRLPGQSQRQHGLSEEVQLVSWSRSMAMLRNSDFSLKVVFTWCCRDREGEARDGGNRKQ